MKKFIFGIIVLVIGLIFSAFCFMYAIMHPGTYEELDGIYADGLRGSLLCADLLIPFRISIIVMLIGLFISGYEAYRRK